MTDERSGPVLVLANEYQIAAKWAREQRLGERDWRHVTRERDVLGRWGGQYVVIWSAAHGHSWEWPGMLHTLRRNGFREWEP